MSCHPEWVYGAYADRELPASERRQVDAHLVSCARCRRLVVALEEEGRLLTHALTAAPRAALPPEPAPAQGLAFAMPLSLAAAVSILTVGGLLLDARLPGGTNWLRPRRFLGVNEMILDVLFAFRDDASGWFELAVGIAALASVAALATFLAGVFLRRVSGPAALGVLLLLAGAALPPPAQAFDLRHEQDVHVLAGERIDGMLLVTGESVVIEGVVDGDLLVFAERVAISGEVLGNLFGGGRELEITGRVTGVVVFGGEHLRTDGEFLGGAYLGGDRVRIAKGTRFARDLVVAGDRIVVDGQVGRDLVSFTQRVEVGGPVGRDLRAFGERVELRTPASVGGNLDVSVPSPEDLVVREGVSIAGETTVSDIDDTPHSAWSEFRRREFWTWHLVGFAASFLVGLGLYGLLPGLFDSRVSNGGEFATALGLGLAALLVVPVVLVLAGLTVVGIPAALIGGACFAIAIYLAGILVASLIGASIVRQHGGGMREFGLALLAGLALVAVAKALPLIGWPTRIVVVSLGMGILILRLRDWRQGRSLGRVVEA